MKRRRQAKKIVIISLIAVTGIIAFRIYVFKFQERGKPSKAPTTGEEEVRDTVKSFTFSSGEELEEWEEKVLVRHNTKYSVIALDEGGSAIKADSEDSASTLYFKQRMSYRKNPFISWDWKAEKFPDFTAEENLDKKSEFDFVAQVYVVFHARFILKSKAIQYVWTESIPKGTVADSPYTKNVKIMVLQSGEPGEWKHEDRNIKADYLQLFGEELKKDIDAVAFMTDSDSTDSSATAYYDNIEISYVARPRSVLPEEKEVQEQPEEEPEPDKSLEQEKDETVAEEKVEVLPAEPEA